ncbi:P60-like protein [Gyrodon lividus]|nr:P60-like protein [Gyrodon lividus]
MVITKGSSPSKSSSKVAQKPVRSSLGAPSQLSQSSRKGKRAWRKNINIQAVEDGLESLRAEERVIGSTLQKQTDNQLFVIDTKGDEQVRITLPRYSKSQLTTAKILSQRSAVPAVVSRATKSSQPKISRTDKERLLRIARRPRKGPFNAVMDPTQFGAGSAVIDVSHAVKASGGHDLWAHTVKDIIPDGLETVQKPNIKKPDLGHPRDIIDVPAVSVPHQGASYNPPVRAHEELLLEVYKVEQRRQEEADKLARLQKKIEQARAFAASDVTEDVPVGMVVDEIMDEELATMTDVAVSRKPAPRKTKQQRARMEKQRAEKRALAEKAARKRLLNSITTIKSLRSEVAKAADARQQASLARQLALRLKLRKGLAGQRLGKYRVPENVIEVQIGEDLSENLRSLKPEGNLFRDRFVSLQQRALIEPRVPVLPTKRKAKLKEYEKHAWKRFE